MDISFKSWLENNVDAKQAIDTDPLLSTAAKKAEAAAMDAVNKGKNPIKAAQTAVVQSKVPLNKLGQVMPQDSVAQAQAK